MCSYSKLSLVQSQALNATENWRLAGLNGVPQEGKLQPFNNKSMAEHSYADITRHKSMLYA